MSGRLEEMPGEEGYPAYLGSRMANFYERAGVVRCLGQDGRIGVLTAIGAVSPPGGDLSDPVVQSTLRIVKVFWDWTRPWPTDAISRRSIGSTAIRCIPDQVDEWMDREISSEWSYLRSQAMILLQEESNWRKLSSWSVDSLSTSDRLKLEAARSLREDFLHQNSFDEIDTYTSLTKQLRMLSLVMQFYFLGSKALSDGAPFRELIEIPVLDEIARLKSVPEDRIVSHADRLELELTEQINSIIPQGVH